MVLGISVPNSFFQTKEQMTALLESFKMAKLNIIINNYIKSNALNRRSNSVSSINSVNSINSNCSTPKSQNNSPNNSPNSSPNNNPNKSNNTSCSSNDMNESIFDDDEKK